MELTKKDRQLEHKIFKICDSELKRERNGLGTKISYDAIGSLFFGAVLGGATYATTKNIPLSLKVAGVSAAVLFYFGISTSLDLHNDEVYQKMEPLLEKAGMDSDKRATLKNHYNTY